MHKHIEALEKERNHYKQVVETLAVKLQDLEFRSGSAATEVRNVYTYYSKCNFGGTSKNCIAKLTDIRDIYIYRIPGKLSVNRPIIAKFSSVPVRNTYTSAVRSFNKGCEKQQNLNSSKLGVHCEKLPIYISEPLSL